MSPAPTGSATPAITMGIVLVACLAAIDAGVVKISTRCLDEAKDKHCGNESAYYPPLIEGVDCVPAVAEHRFSGKRETYGAEPRFIAQLSVEYTDGSRDSIAASCGTALP